MIIAKKEPCFFATGNYIDFSSTKNALAGDLGGRRDERAPPGVHLDGLRRHRRGRVVEEQARPHEADDRAGVDWLQILESKYPNFHFDFAEGQNTKTSAKI